MSTSTETSQTNSSQNDRDPFVTLVALLLMGKNMTVLTTKIIIWCMVMQPWVKTFIPETKGEWASVLLLVIGSVCVAVSHWKHLAHLRNLAHSGNGFVYNTAGQLMINVAISIFFVSTIPSTFMFFFMVVIFAYEICIDIILFKAINQKLKLFPAPSTNDETLVV